MKETAELDLLAERYLDLWERQLAALLDDPASMRTLEIWLAVLNGSHFASARDGPAGDDNDAGPGD